MPDFELIQLKAIQSHANGSTHFETWFDAMDYLKNEISKVNFDIAILYALGLWFAFGGFCKKYR